MAAAVQWIGYFHTVRFHIEKEITADKMTVDLQDGGMRDLTAEVFVIDILWFHSHTILLKLDLVISEKLAKTNLLFRVLKF